MPWSGDEQQEFKQCAAELDEINPRVVECEQKVAAYADTLVGFRC